MHSQTARPTQTTNVIFIQILMPYEKRMKVVKNKCLYMSGRSINGYNHFQKQFDIAH